MSPGLSRKGAGKNHGQSFKRHTRTEQWSSRLPIRLPEKEVHYRRTEPPKTDCA